MDCFICGNEALLLRTGPSGRSVNCPECGIYEARGDFNPACRAVAEGLRSALDRQRSEAVEPAVLTSQAAYLLYVLSRVGLNSRA